MNKFHKLIFLFSMFGAAALAKDSSKTFFNSNLLEQRGASSGDAKDLTETFLTEAGCKDLSVNLDITTTEDANDGFYNLKVKSSNCQIFPKESATCPSETSAKNYGGDSKLKICITVPSNKASNKNNIRVK